MFLPNVLTTSITTFTTTKLCSFYGLTTNFLFCFLFNCFCYLLKDDVPSLTFFGDPIEHKIVTNWMSSKSQSQGRKIQLFDVHCHSNKSFSASYWCIGDGVSQLKPSQFFASVFIALIYFWRFIWFPCSFIAQYLKKRNLVLEKSFFCSFH